MEAIEGISIGIFVVKDKNHLKAKIEKQSDSENNIKFINIEEHKKFVENIFSIFEPVSKREKQIAE